MRYCRGVLFSVVSAVLAMGAVSCQSSRRVEIIDVPQPRASESVDGAALAYKLANKPWCSNQDAVSMVLLMVAGEDRYENFQERVTVLESRGIVRPEWNLKPDTAVTKGTVAYMLCRALKIKGGVMMHLIPCRRYAYHTAVNVGLVARGADYEPLSGPEALGIFGRAARMKETL